VVLAIGVDVNGSVLPVVTLDCLGDSIEEESLSVSVSVSSKSKVGAVGFNNSSHWKSGSEVEWSVDMEAEFAVVALL